MDEIPQAEVQEIGHLGLVAAVVKKFKISEKISPFGPLFVPGIQVTEICSRPRSI